MMKRTCKEYEVVVLGGGLAGIAAALGAKTGQNRVLLMTKGFGSYYYGPGWLDLFGSNRGKIIKNPWAWMDKTPVGHPYRLLGEKRVRQALKTFLLHLEEAGLSFLSPENDENFFLPTALGSIRPTYLAPLSLAQGEIKPGEKIKIFGVEGFHYFSPQIVAENLVKGYQRLGMTVKAGWGKLIAEKTRPATVSAYDLALWFDEPEHTEKVIKQVMSQLDEEEKIGFPAILGLENHPQVLRQIEEGTGRKVFEIPTLPPSVPGIRWHHHLVKLMGKKGIDYLTGYPAFCADINGDGISRVHMATPGKVTSLQGEKFILATGGVASDGLVSGPGWVREPLFNLPVNYQKGLEKWSRANLLTDQPYACFGIRVDEKMRPLDEKGRPCYANLYAAGSILANFDGVAEKSTGGVDIATGMAAGAECGGEG